MKISAFYKFVTIDNPIEMQSALQGECERHSVRGSILIAQEGVNGTISGAGEAVDRVIAWLRADARFASLEIKEAAALDHAFKRLKVLVKPEIVAMGAPEANPAARVGVHVPPAAWNALIADPSVTVIDARNDYEVRIGTFERAIDPQTRAFSDFPAFAQARLDPARHRKIAMFCTGGIRCEKASSLLLAQGFDEVYHLKGGILKYLEVIPPADSLWRGECFVFDERVAVTHGLAAGSHCRCAGCGDPVPVIFAPEKQPAYCGACENL